MMNKKKLEEPRTGSYVTVRKSFPKAGQASTTYSQSAKSPISNAEIEHLRSAVVKALKSKSSK